MNSTHHRFKLYASAALCVAIVASSATSRAGTVFRETFDRANNSTFGTNSGPEGSGTWTKTIVPLGAGTQGTLTINSNQALASHNAGDGVFQLGIPTSSFASPYPVSAKFSDAPGKITWNVNMQSNVLAPNGIGAAAAGMGLALGATNSSFGAIGNNGYILYIGNTGTPDPIHLAEFTGNGAGSTLVDVMTVSTAPFTNVGASANYFSFRVELDPSTNTWELFGRDDGASAFADPEVNTGYVSLGTGVNSTYTSTALPVYGLVGAWKDAGGFVSRYDNLTVGVVPEPSSMALIGLGLAAFAGYARQHNQKYQRNQK